MTELDRIKIIQKSVFRYIITVDCEKVILPVSEGRLIENLFKLYGREV